MRREGTLKHNIDVLFLMVLFVILTFSAVSVLLLAINSYRNVVNASESNASARTASAYIREIIHQHDTDGNVTLGDLGGIDSIVIDDGDDYYIYIYEFEGNLCELDMKADSGADWRDGEIIMKLVNVSFSYVNENTIEAVVGDTYGNEEVVDVCLKSKEDSHE